ncbi:titin-like [Rana temporaria]|uniref:titin-like n=1 Tax=Rana temporaria TaxID=8407 RepID=UPI001AAC6B0D|nr:titin-like [Rana temporaria]
MYSLNSSTTAVNLTSLTPGNLYVIEVSANDVPFNITLNTEPGKVQNLTTSNFTTTSITLTWQQPVGNVSHYVVQMVGSSSSNTTTQTTYMFESLTPGNNYTFLVYSVVSNKSGQQETIPSYTKPATIKNLKSESATINSISLSWQQPDGIVDHYKIVNSNTSSTITTSSTTAVIGSLTPGNPYSFWIYAVIGSDIEGDGTNIIVYTIPEIVKNLNTENITTTSISLRWDKPNGNASFYFIQILGEPTFNKNVTTTSEIIEGLTPGNYYTFLVSTFVDNIQGNSSAIANYTIPEMVKNLNTENITTTSISLRWDKPIGNASFYFIQVLGEPTFNKNVTTTSDIIEGLTPGNYYTFLVSTFIDNIQGNSSVIANYTIPEMVKNLNTENITTTSISLRWDKPIGNASFYFIQVLGDPAFNKNVTTTSDIIEGLTPGNYYTFLVSTFVDNIQGNSSAIANYTIPEMVKNLNTENITTTSISLRWDKPIGNASFYLIQVVGDPAFNKNVTTTSDIIEGLTPGNYYTFLVSTFVDNIQGNSSAIANYTIPEMVKNLNTENITTTSISLRWDKPIGNASFYFIQVLGDPAFNKNVTTTSDIIEGLTPGNYYTFLVSTFVDNIQGNSSAIANYTIPEMVKNLNTENITTTSISLRWDKPIGNASFYLIQVVGDPAFNKNVTTTSDIIEGLTPGNYYTFLVSTFVDNIQGNSSAIANYTIPEMVKNLNTENITTTSISLRWDKPIGNASFYLIQVVGDTAFNKNVTTTSDIIEGLTPGNYYTFLVSTFVDNIQGNSSAIANYTIPEMVKNLNTENITTTSISLRWDKPIGNASFYLIQVVGDTAFNKNVTTTSDIIEGLTPGNYYTFLVSTFVDNIQGNSSAIANYTIPEMVKNLNTENITTTSISLRWDKPIGNASFYLIQVVGDTAFNKNVTTTSDIIEGLTPGNYYTFLVSTFVDNIQGNSSAIVNYTIPEMVKNLNTENTTTTSISLRWDKPIGNASFYFIQVLGDPAFNKNVTTTSDIIEGLTPGNYYTFLVSTFVDNIQGNSSVIANYTIPEMVKNLNTENITTTSISLRWDKPIGNASFYFIQVLGDPAFNKNVTTTSDIIEGLTPGNYYTFLVSTFVDNIQGNSSVIANYTIPEMVKNLNTENITTTSISLRWDKPIGNASFYLIQVVGDTAFNKNVTTTSDIIEGLTPGNYYTFLVSTFVDNIQGNSSAIANYTIPEMVKNLNTENTTTTSISLRWDKPIGNASFYFIQVLGDPAFNKNVTTTSDIIEGLTPGNYYTFLVSTFVDNIQGNSSAIVNYTIPEMVKNLNTENITTTSISLRWDKPIGNASFYFIQVLGDPAFNKNVTTTSDIIEGLTPGNYYTFLVSTFVDNIQGNSSVIANYTIPEMVKNLNTENITTTSISLRWDKPIGNASFYLIQVVGDTAFNKNVTTTSDIIEGLTPGNYYTFLVSTFVDNIQGNSSAIANYTIPEMVKNLNTENITTTSISLRWDKPIGNASFYFIQVLGDPAFNKNVTTTSDIIEGLTPGNYYTFLVSTFVDNIQGNSSVIANYTIPEIVKNLNTENITTTSISLRWDKPIGNASFYFIQVLGDTAFNKNVTTTSDIIEGLTPGNYYTFLVSTFVDNIQGNSSAIANYTIPEMVKNLNTENITTTSISLRWDKPIGNASFYFIQVLGDTAFNKNVTTTSDIIEGLTPGNYYTFLVSTFVDNIQGNSSAIANYTIPEMVKNLNTENITTTSISLRWDKPIGNASFYFIQVLGDPAFNKNVTTTSDIIEGLTPGNYYTFLVSTFVDNIQGNSSAIANYTIPEMVKNLNTENITTTSISLRWDKPIGNASFYFIQVLGDPAFNKNVTTTSDIIEGLTPGNYYTFLVSTFVDNIQGNSSVIANYTIPEMVKNLNTENITTTSISLRWDKPIGNASFYLIQVVGDTAFNKNVTTTSDIIEGLTPGNYYTFLVSTFVDNIQGNSSAIANYTIPEMVKNLNTENITTTSISLRWDKPIGNASFYFIQVLGDPAFNKNVTTTSDIIEGLTPGNYYTFLVSTFVDNIQGNSSAIANYTIPEMVKNLNTENITTTSISLRWDKPIGNASFYLIQVVGDTAFNKNVTTTSDIIEGLTPGNYYTFLVSTFVDNIQGNSSAIANYTIPEMVKNLNTENITTTSISLRWDKPIGNASFYFIQVLGDPAFNKNVTTTSDIIEGLTPGNYYTFLVSTFVDNIQGNSSVIANYTIPEMVKNLNTENITTTSISLRWDKPIGNASFYLIQVVGDTAFNKNVTTTSDIIEGLTPGNYYTFLVSTFVDNIQGNSSAIANYTIPEMVKNLNTENTTTTSISLRWDKPIGNASFYFIQVLGDPAFNKNVTTTSDIIEGLTPGNYYTFLVSTFVDNIQGNSSAIANYTIPEMVKNLNTENITTTSISLRWDKPIGNASFYFIQVLGDPAFNKNVTTTSDIIEGLTPGNYYTFLVSTFVDNIQGNSSAIANYTIPEMVKNLNTENTTTTSISLRWDKPNGNASFYFIQVVGDTAFNKNVTTTSDIIEGLTPGNYYTFLVSTFVDNIQGNSSAIANYTIPEIVKNLNTENITTTSISLRWDKPNGNASFYFIQVLGEPAFNKNVTTTSEIIEGLTPGNYYTFLVSPFVDTIQGNSSVIANYTKPGVIKNLVPDVNTSSISLRWEIPDGNVSYYSVQILGEPTISINVSVTLANLDGLIAGNYYTVVIYVIVEGDAIPGEKYEIQVYTKPGMVKNVLITNATTESVDLSWLPPDGNYSYYIIEVPEGIFPNTTTSQSISIQGLTPGKRYNVQIIAVTGPDVQGEANITATYTRPGMVYGIIPFVIQTSSVHLAWQPPALGAWSYYVIRMQENSTLYLTTNNENILISELIPGNNYTFLISVQYFVLESAQQLISLYTKPAAVINMKASRINSTAIYVSWQLPEGNKSYYQVDVVGDPAQSSNVTTESASVTNLTIGNPYTVNVAAVAANGLLGESSHISVAVSDVFSVTIIYSTSIQLNWDIYAVKNATYIISVSGEPSTYKTLNTTEIQIYNLTAGNCYTFAISASLNTFFLYGYGGEITLCTRPGPVKQVLPENITTSSVDISWLPPDGNHSYYQVQVTGNTYANQTVSQSWSVQGLTPGNQYTININAVNGQDMPGISSQVTITTKPEKVKNLTIFTTTDTSVTLSWQPPDGSISSYLINIQQNETYNQTTNLNTFTVNDLTPGTYYNFTVSALAGFDTVRGESVLFAGYTPPGIVKNLINENITTTSISLRWDKPIENASFYFIQVLGDPAFTKNVTTTSDIVEGLTPGNYYTFLVSTFVDNIQGNSSVIANYTIPEMVKNLNTENITTTSISLRWDEPIGNASFYFIQILGDPAFNKNVTTTSDIIEGLTPGNYYTFLVSTFVDNIQGNSSAIANYTIPEIVKNLNTENITTSSISLRWDKPIGNASFYFIQVLGDPAFNKNVTTTSDIIEGLTPGNYYTFLVSTFVDNIQGNSSVIANYTIPEMVRNLNTENITTTSISLRWDKPNGNASFYFIQVLGEQTFNKNVTTTSDIIEGLTPGNYYTFIVSTFVDNIQGNSSAIANYTIPEIVKNLNTENITTTSISLRWDKPIGNASFYFIQILGDPAFNKNVTTTSDIIEGLTPGNYYTFLVSTFVDNIQGNSSAIANYTIPEMVKNLNTENITTTSISLRWDKPNGNASFYFIQVLGDPAFNKNVTTTSDIIEGLTPGNYYIFLVSTFVDNIQGNSSAIANYTIPEIVKDLNTENITTTSISLRWDKPIGNASFYVIQIVGEPAFNKNVTTTSDIIEGLTPGNYYTFLVSTFVDNIQGNSSVIANYTIPEMVKNLNTENTTTTSISLRWDKPIGNASFYFIQVLGEPTFNKNVTTTSDIIEGLTPGNYYTFLVSTFVDNIQGNSSAIANYTIPEIVKNLNTENITTTSISLRWDKPIGNARFYLIQVVGDPAFNKNVTTTSDIIEGLTPGNYYTFLVSTFVDNIQGNSSAIANYTIPAMMKNLNTENITTTSISLRWDKPIGNASFYFIQVLGEPAFNKNVTTTSDIIEGLTPGNYYTFLVSTFVDNIQGNSSVIANYTIPEMVKNLNTENITTTSISLRWDKPIGNASFYFIQILGEPAFDKNVTTTSDIIEGLTPGNDYTFIVSTFVDNIQGNSSAIANYTIPEMVKNLNTENITTTSISLRWDKPIGNASFYFIQILGDPAFNKNVTTTSDIIEGLTPGNYYTFLVSTFVDNIQGNSSVIANYTIPEVVKNLNTENINTTSISLRWDKPIGNASFYFIQVLGDPAFNKNVTTTSEMIEGLTPGNYYTFLVSTFVDNIQGNSSAIANYTIPEIVKNLNTENITTTSISLRWDEPIGNASFYFIQVLGDPAFNKNVTTTSDIIEGLTPGNYYTFLVSTFVDNIQGNSSVIANYTIPEVVKNLNTENINTTSISLRWDKPNGNTSFYFIQVLGDPAFNKNVTTTSEIIEGLTPGNYYTFLVSTFVDNIQGNSSAIANYTIPEMVKNLNTENITTTSISLRWDEPIGNASFYFIQVLGDPAFNKNVTTTSDIIEGLTPGNYYTFLVSTFVDNIQGNSSAIANYTIPEIVKNLNTENITTTSISLRWDKPNGNASFYFIQVLGEPTFNKNVTTTSEIIEGLTPGNYYTFLVSTFVDNIQGNSSAIANYTIPEIVKNLNTENITTTSISLRWDKPNGNASLYFIQILGDPAFNKNVTTTSDIIEGLTPGNYYTFLVSTFVDNIQGNSSAIANYTIPEIVKNLNTENITTTSISLRWDKPNGNASFYFIQILGDPAFNKNVTTTSDIIEGLTPGNYYTFLVSTFVDNIQGNSSAIANYTIPEIVKNLNTENITTTSISLRWDKPIGNASFYFIQILGEPAFTKNVTTTSDIIEGLTPGNYYTFLVSTFVDNIQGSSSAIANYTKPGVIKNLVPDVNTSSISLRWEIPDGNVSYYSVQILGEPTISINVSVTLANLDGLIAGNYYTVLIYVIVEGDVIPGEKYEIQVYTKPGMVKNVLITNVTTESVDLSWLPPDGNYSYYIIEVPEGIFPNTTTSQSISIQGLTPGKRYNVQIIAVTGPDVQGEANITATYTRPGMVYGIIPFEVQTSSVHLTWQPPALGAWSYYVIRMQENSTLYLTTSNENILISELIPGSNYTFLISVQYFDLESAQQFISLYTKPAAVINMKASRINSTAIYVSWQLPEGNKSYYQVDVVGDPAQSSNVTTESASVTNLTIGNPYTVNVAAVAANGLLGESSHISVAVSNVFSVTIIYSTSIQLNWDIYAVKNATYIISVSGEPSTYKTLNTTEIQIYNLTEGNCYTFAISASLNKFFLYGYGGEITLCTRPGPVKQVLPENITTSSVDISWLPPDGNHSYYQVQVTGNTYANQTVSQSWSVQGLTPGNQYTININAVNGQDMTGNSSQVTITTKPEKVKNLTVFTTTDTSVTLSWQPPDGSISSYLINIQQNETYNQTTNLNTFTVNDLTPGTYYNFTVSALAGFDTVRGESVLSAGYTLPEIVKNLNTENITTTSISLRWDKPNGNASFYFIQVLGDPAFNKNVTTTSDIIEGLTPGNYYTFLVSTFVDNIQGNSSAIANYTIPEIVKNLNTGNITTTSISLRWDKPNGNASFYFIQILGDPTFNKNVTTTSDIIEGLTPGNYYTFLVSTFVDNIQGNSSVIANYTIPEMVKNLNTENITTTSISLRWDKPIGNASFYFIQILGEPAFNKNVTTTSDTIEGLTPGNYYTFLVSTFVDNIQGNSSVIANYTIPEIVKNLNTENITTTSISLRWDKPNGNASLYFIQILGETAFNKNVTTTSDIIEGLTPGNYYTFLVSTFVDNIQGNTSAIANYTIPEIVKNLNTENITTTSISLRWDKPIGNASFYFIQILGEPAFNKNVTTTSDIIEGLTPGNYYTFIVSTFVDNIQGNSSVIANYTIPEMVKNLNTEHITTTSISLRWDKPNGNASFYFIRILGEPAFNKNVTTTSDIIEGLTPGNYYTFLVSTFVDNIQGNSSAIANYTIPEIVKNLNTENITTNSISLRWDKPNGKASFYFIQILGEPTFNKNVTRNSDIIEGLTPGNYYSFLVSTFVDNIQGNSSVIANYTIPEMVKNLNTENITTTSISLRWDKPNGNASFYFIQILGEPAFNKNVTTTSDIIEGLTPGNYYTFIVSTFVDNIQGNSSAIANYTIPEMVKNLNTENITTTSISLRWDKPIGNASFYFIQILGEPTFNKNVTSTSDIIEGLTPGNYYTFIVSTFVDNIQGNSSAIANYTIPEIVKNLNIENITTDSISLRWDKPIGNASFYFIQILGEPSFNKNVTRNSDIIEGLTPGNYYTFLVSTFVDNIQGNSSVIANYTIPEMVKNLNTENITTTSISLRWDKPIGNASFYFTQILGEPTFNKNVTSTSDIIEGLTPGNYYTFLVSTFVDNIQGNSSVISNYTIPEMVKNLNTENITTTSISLRWDKPIGNASFYFIQVLGDPAFNKNVTTTSDIIEGLTPGNYYTFIVSTFVDNIQGNSSAIANYTIPEMVKNLNTENITTTSISLRWDKPIGNASFYFIQILGEPTFNKNVTTTSDIIEGLTPGNYYTFLVSTFVDNIQGNSSVIANYTIPEIVKNLITENINTTSISLRWDKPIGNASFYFIQILGDPAFNKNVTTTSDIIEGLTPGNYYTFIVSTFVDNIQGSSSVIAKYTIPEIVKNLNTENINTTSISLRWDKPIGNASFYFIQILGEPTFNKNVTTTSEIIEGLTPGNYYTFLVSTFVDNIQGNSSAIANYTIPEIVKNLNTENITNTSISLRWDKPNGNARFYYIQILGEPAFNKIATTTSDIIEGLTPGNYYTFLVSAFVDNIQGSSSVTANYTIPGIVKNLITEHINTTSISLRWDKPIGNASFYFIQVLGEPAINKNVTTTSDIIKGLTPGNYYTFLVSTFVDNIQGNSSAIANYTIPEVVKNLNTENINTTSISLRWDKPNGNASFYFIQVLGEPAINKNVTTTSEIIEGLTPGNYYTFLVSTFVDNIQGNSSVIANYTIPEVVKNLNTENINTTSISLRWDKPNGNASFYFIQVLGEPAINKNVTTTSEIIEGLTPGNYYTFLVSTFVDNIQGNSSVIANYTIPEVVKNLNTENINTTSISLRWDKPDGNVSSYYIQILGDPAFDRNVTTTSDTITGLTPGNYYTFLVSAVVDGGNVKGAPNITSDYTIPEVVKNLNTENINTTSISLRWEKPDGNVSSYYIQILGDPAFDRNVTTTSDTITGLTPGNYYTFLVSAVVDGGNVKGTPNITTDYTRPEKVQSLTAYNINTTSVSLNWLPPTGNASSYQIQIWENSSFSKIVPSPTTTFTIQNLTPGNYYTFLVSALAGGSINGNSSLVVKYTKPGTVKNLVPQNITTDAISLSWEKPDGNVSSYMILIKENSTFQLIITTNYVTIGNLQPGNGYTFLVFALTDNSRLQGDNVSTFTRTNSLSFIVSISYQSSVSDSDILILNLINEKLKTNFPKQNVTAVIKKVRKIS